MGIEEIRKRVMAQVKPVKPVKAVLKPIVIAADEFEEKLNQNLANSRRTDLETTPRETVLKMLGEKKLDEHFIFQVAKGEGENYIQAMRQVLSRTRKKALKKKVRLSDFRLLTVDVKTEADCDVITLVRTRSMSEHQESVYDEILAAFQKPDK